MADGESSCRLLSSLVSASALFFPSTSEYSSGLWASLSVGSICFFLGRILFLLLLLFLSCKVPDNDGLPTVVVLLLCFRFRFLSRRFKYFFSSYLPCSFLSSVSSARSFVRKDTIREASSISISMVRSDRKFCWISEMLWGPSSSLLYSRHQQGSMSVVEATVALRTAYSFMMGSFKKFSRE